MTDILFRPRFPRMPRPFRAVQDATRRRHQRAIEAKLRRSLPAYLLRDIGLIDDAPRRRGDNVRRARP